MIREKGDHPGAPARLMRRALGNPRPKEAVPNDRKLLFREGGDWRQEEVNTPWENHLEAEFVAL
ncbi:MAG: hypothetical protein ACE5JX_12665, partial [Acidobacteriota bacterium]